MYKVRLLNHMPQMLKADDQGTGIEENVFFQLFTQVGLILKENNLQKLQLI